MLDRATLLRLSKTPEKNAPMLNVALAEEGEADVLLALAQCSAVGPEALSVVGDRIHHEKAFVGRDPATPLEDLEPIQDDLDRLLVAHPNAPGALRDAILFRHPKDAFFVLGAASHPRATTTAVERAALWPAASAMHDRLWLALLDPKAIAPLTQAEWADDPSPLRREAVARISRDPALLTHLAKDPSRRVRRAVASNRFAGGELRAELAASDPACEVRARAAGSLTAHNEAAEIGSIASSARFAASLRAMASGGVLAPDVVRALAGGAAELDEEGAMLAAQVLPRADLAALMEQVIERGPTSKSAVSLAAGLALRAPEAFGAENEGDSESELAEIVYDTVQCLSHSAAASSPLTGKARLAAWAAEGLTLCPAVDWPRLLDELARGPIAAERMILGRAAARLEIVRELCAAAEHAEVIPAALLELAWTEPTVSDATVVSLAARIAKPRKRAEDLPEDEIDLDPAHRPLDVLERTVLAAVLRANVSPRSALAVTSLDSRRVRYVLSAMPQWKGRITGGRLARVLRQHAGALSAAHAEGRARAAKVEVWTERLMQETEMAIALAVGHLTGAEVAHRILQGRQVVNDGLTLAYGAEARAALEGAASVAPVLAWATKARTESGPALAVWLLLERLDRERTPALVASTLDSMASLPQRTSALQAGKAAVIHPSVTDALAAVERRRPGRLETIHPQSPRGRATLASAIARAYRAIGGMRDERQGP